MPAEAGVEVDGPEENEIADSVESGDGGGSVSLRSCDPGPDADLAITTPYDDALLLPVVRLQLAYGQLAGGADPDVAVCRGDRVLRELTFEDVTSDELTPDLEKRLTDLTTAAVGFCR